MFDIGFWEIALIGIIALLIVGPDEFPSLVRNINRWVNKIRRFIQNTKADINQELHNAEILQLEKDGKIDDHEHLESLTTSQKKPDQL
ncbi:MAG: Sec-independent protein translocase protein TatB [Gammaproteobacteria bacterium]|nr:Sec-independent protein translocase protein TatB [Gammaproteobacteria bacterium]